MTNKFDFDDIVYTVKVVVDINFARSSELRIAMTWNIDNILSISGRHKVTGFYIHSNWLC